jgi:HEAT repeat protein
MVRPPKRLFAAKSQMPITHYCPECWNEIGEQRVCPKCGVDLQHFAKEPYEEKLIRALRHPEPTVPVRAAMILGELRSEAGVTALIETAFNTRDPYLQEAVAQALGAIGNKEALPCLEHLRMEGALRVRVAAELALGHITGKTNLE